MTIKKYSKLTNIFNFTTETTNLIRSYLSDRKQFVVNNNIKSDLLSTKTGVPQGSILGPLLFSLYINDLPDILSFCSCHLYADDCQIYIDGTNSDQKNVISRMNADIKAIENWSSENFLTLNAKKTQAIILCNKNSDTDRNKNSYESINVLNNKIDYSKFVKNLGVFIDCHLSFKKHVNFVCSKIYATLKGIVALRKFTDKEMRIKLVKSLIIPHFTYADLIFSAASCKAINKLQISYNSCIRYIFNLRKHDSVSDYRSLIFGMPLQEYYKFRAISFVRKCLIGECPEYFQGYFVASGSHRRCDLIMPEARMEVGNKSFKSRGSRLWNSLPNVIKRIPILSQHKTNFEKQCIKFLSTSVI